MEDVQVDHICLQAPETPVQLAQYVDCRGGTPGNEPRSEVSLAQRLNGLHCACEFCTHTLLPSRGTLATRLVSHAVRRLAALILSSTPGREGRQAATSFRDEADQGRI